MPRIRFEGEIVSRIRVGGDGLGPLPPSKSRKVIAREDEIERRASARAPIVCDSKMAIKPEDDVWVRDRKSEIKVEASLRTPKSECKAEPHDVNRVHIPKNEIMYDSKVGIKLEEDGLLRRPKDEIVYEDSKPSGADMFDDNHDDEEEDDSDHEDSDEEDDGYDDDEPDYDDFADCDDCFGMYYSMGRDMYSTFARGMCYDDIVEVCLHPLRNDETHMGIRSTYSPELNSIFREHGARWEPRQKLWMLPKSRCEELRTSLQRENEVHGRCVFVDSDEKPHGRFLIRVTFTSVPDASHFGVASGVGWYDYQILNEVFRSVGGKWDAESSLWVISNESRNKLTEDLVALGTVEIIDHTGEKAQERYEDVVGVQLWNCQDRVVVQNPYSEDLRMLYKGIPGSVFDQQKKYGGCGWSFPLEMREKLVEKLRASPFAILQQY